MAPRKRKVQEEGSWSPNQLVAYNLARARKLRGLTQEEAARKIEPYLGELWSKATFSAAERSVSSGRVRQFTANEIVAFALAFELPIGWFFFPAEEYAVGRAVPSSVPGATKHVWPGELAERAVALSPELEARLAGMRGSLSHPAWKRIQDLAQNIVSALVAGELGDLGRRAQELRGIAEAIDKARATAAEQVMATWQDESEGGKQ